MAAPKWQPGKLYAPGSLVVPRTALPTDPVALQNPGWETGDTTGWDVELSQTGTGFAGVRAKDPHDGAYIYALDGTSGSFNATVTALNKEQPACAEGTIITARMWVRRSSGDPSSGRVIIRWYDSAGDAISTTEGALQTQSEKWLQATASAAAPAGTATVRVGFSGSASGDGDIRFDTLTWNYDSSAPTKGLMYKAVQPAIGASDDTEPTWPTALGAQVIDNEVIWEAVLLSRLVWQARPILRSGATEPTWPTVVGERVPDNTIAWETTSRRVEDENCPDSKVTLIIASKVFKPDGDIVRFSATANPLDWTTERDAGYLPTGLQSANANDMAVLQQYRGNLVAFNASSFQNWQADPDPAAMALLDQMEGIGSSWNKAAQPVANELLFLSQQGFRSVGIAAGAENLAAGDVGEPVDELVRAAVGFIGANGRVVSTYYPGAGQFWGCFPASGANETWTYVYTMSGRKGKWSRYRHPYAIECFAQLGDDLYVRHGDAISRVDEDATSDEVDGVAVDFGGTVWWPWLDFGQTGVTKQLEGFDYIGTGQGPSIQIGYDQRNVSVMTPAYQLSNDTLPGGIIPLPVSAPTFSVKLTFAGGEKWRVNAVNLSFFDLANGP